MAVHCGTKSWREERDVHVWKRAAIHSEKRLSPTFYFNRPIDGCTPHLWWRRRSAEVVLAPNTVEHTIIINVIFAVFLVLVPLVITFGTVVIVNVVAIEVAKRLAILDTRVVVAGFLAIVVVIILEVNILALLQVGGVVRSILAKEAGIYTAVHNTRIRVLLVRIIMFHVYSVKEVKTPNTIN